MIRILIPLLLSLLIAACGPEPQENHTPSDSLAIETVSNLYDNLFRIADSSIMVAHQDALSYGVNCWGSASCSPEEFREDPVTLFLSETGFIYD